MTEMEHLKFVIVGHVDHGKSTLIGRLFFDTNSIPQSKVEEIKNVCEAQGSDLEFAFLMDHLEEERRQGITIDTAQIFFKTAKRQYVIIDAPGHVEFVKNMITGASQAEAAILIIDANEGLQEQTRRHAYILGLLGLNQVIVTINKMDLVGYQESVFNRVAQETVAFLDKLNIKPAYILPMSAKEGDNIAKTSPRLNWFQGPTILAALDTFVPHRQPVEKDLRFPIQDVYKVDGKRILVGRIETGKISTGQKVAFFPAGTSSRVKSIEAFLQEKVTAEAGQSIGITLTDPLFIERGQVACPQGSQPGITQRFRAHIFWMAKTPFEIQDKVFIRCATQETEARIEVIEERVDSSTLDVLGENDNQLSFNEVGKVIIQTESPLVLESFYETPELGRFVLVRDFDVVAGGIVTQTADLEV